MSSTNMIEQGEGKMLNGSKGISNIRSDAQGNERRARTATHETLLVMKVA